MRDRATCGGNYSVVLAEALAERGASVELWSDVTTHDRVTASVPIVPIWHPGIRAWSDIVRAVVLRRPAVVHLQHYAFLFGRGASGELSTIALVVALGLLGTRVVVTLHDVPAPELITPAYVRENHYGYPAAIVRAGIGALFRAIGACARVVIVHESRLAEFAGRFGVPRAKIRVIPHMALPARAVDRDLARRELGIAEDAPYVLFFGFANPYKGIENLLAAFALLGRRGSPVRLLLGMGARPKAPDEPQYRRYYAGLRAIAEKSDNVTFVGYIPDERLGTYVRAADLGVVPYIQAHGASGPLHHFLAYDQPVIVSKHVAMHATELADCAFGDDPAEIADAIAAFFAGETADHVRRECARLRESTFAGKYVELTEAAYLETRAPRVRTA